MEIQELEYTADRNWGSGYGNSKEMDWVVFEGMGRGGRKIFPF